MFDFTKLNCPDCFTLTEEGFNERQLAETQDTHLAVDVLEELLKMARPNGHAQQVMFIIARNALELSKLSTERYYEELAKPHLQ